MELSLIFGPIRPRDRSSRLGNNGNGLRSTKGEPIKHNGRFNYFYITFVSECTAVDNFNSWRWEISRRHIMAIRALREFNVLRIR